MHFAGEQEVSDLLHVMSVSHEKESLPRLCVFCESVCEPERAKVADAAAEAGRAPVPRSDVPSHKERTARCCASFSLTLETRWLAESLEVG